jgi:predicted esterase
LGFGNLNGRDQDEAGILRSRAYFNTLIDEEINAGIPSNRIVIGGFSQGGAMAIFTGVTSRHHLGGVFGLSCYLLLQDKIKGLAPENQPNKDTEIFMGHGTSDPLVKPEWGLLTANTLKQMGHTVKLKMYP